MLRAWRRSKGWTQDAAAAHWEISLSRYVQWELYGDRPGSKMISRMWAEGVCEPNAWFDRPDHIPHHLLAETEREAML